MLQYPTFRVLGAGGLLFGAGVLVTLAFRPGPWTRGDIGLLVLAVLGAGYGISTLVGLYRAQRPLNSSDDR